MCLHRISAQKHMPVIGYVTESIRRIANTLRGMKHGQNAVRWLCITRRLVFRAYSDKK